MVTFLFAAEEAGAAADEAAHTLKILPATDELLWGSIAFLMLLFALLKYVFPKLREGLEKRSAAIAGQIEQAERTRREADDMLEQYRQQLADARAEVQRIIDEGKRTADALRQDLVRKAEQEAQEIVQRARQEVSGERERAMGELRSTLSDLSIQLATRVIQSELRDSDAQRRLVDRAIEELTATGNGHRAN